MRKENSDIRIAAKQAGVTLWAIADQMGISEATMTRMLRKKLSDVNRQRVMEAIALIKGRDGIGTMEGLHEIENT